MLDLRQKVASVLDSLSLEHAQIGLHALLSEKPNLHFVRSLRQRLESQVADRLHPLRLAAVLRSDSPSVQVMLGLCGALLLGVGLTVVGNWVVGRPDQKILVHIPLHLLLAVAAAGVVGSVTSILVRIRSFEQAQATSPASMVLLGFTKPLVGAAFAIFFMMLLKSELLPILRLPEAGQQAEIFLFLAFENRK